MSNRLGHIRNLESIPGVGPNLARDLKDVGILWVGDLEGKDPEELYEHLCEIRGARIDPCVLYVFRSAVYYATEADPDPELLKWWNWKDRKA